MATDTTTRHLDDTSFAAEAGSGLAMVDFWAPWCPPCRALGPTVDALAGEYQGRVTVAKVNTDEAKRTAASFSVQSIPTIVFLKDGQEVERLVGLRSQDELSAALDRLIES